MTGIRAPHLMAVHAGLLHPIEQVILSQVATIEAWFRQRWQETPAPITSSVDLRHAGFKLAPVDTNLFPAGFNNLNPDFLPLCIHAAQTIIEHYDPGCTKIVILPESHTRNRFYLQSLNQLRTIFVKAGFVVRIGSLDPEITVPTSIPLDNGETLLLEPLIRTDSKVGLHDLSPCLILLNNDLSSGIPEILQGIEQPIQPSIHLGWSTRLKSTHFQYYAEVANEFATLAGMDPWLINPLFSAVDNVDFMAQEGIQRLADAVDELLATIRQQYALHNIKESPFVAVKADNGTYGMSVMMVREGNELLQLNRKQRTKMSTSKGNQKVTRVIIQEGVYTFETMPDGAVAEPVLYMMGPFVVGGFYRVHKGRNQSDNLNAPGMHFEPLAFTQACNMPCEDHAALESYNQFYVYGVIARLAALAAAREAHSIQQPR